jgi:hypothetical protein
MPFVGSKSRQIKKIMDDSSSNDIYYSGRFTVFKEKDDNVAKRGKVILGP